jgi:predicted DNA-binding transcriptional regulator AlpA
MQSTQRPTDDVSQEINGSAKRPPYLPVKDTADLLGVSPLSVYRRYHANRFPGRKFGRSIKILTRFVDDLAAEINSGRPVDVDEFAAQWLAESQLSAS